jgi:hypothetical protein
MSNLVSENFTLDHIRNKTEEQTENERERERERDLEKNLKYTETDMHFELFANKDKMVPPDEVRTFKKGDVVNDYLNEPSNPNLVNINNNNNTQVPPVVPIINTTNNNTNNNTNTQEPIFNNQNTQSLETRPEDMFVKKLDLLRKLGELQHYGVKLTQNYNMNSDYDTMKFEYELHTSIRKKQNGVKWMSGILVYGCKGMEMMNDKYNPFEIKLKGWAETVNSDASEYYDTLGEIYELYFSGANKTHPLLKLAGLLGWSALQFHAIKSMTAENPDINDIISNNPQLADKLLEKATQDKLAKNREATQASLNKSFSKEHDLARQKAADIQMLKEQKEIFIKQQQQLNELQNNLQQHQSNDGSQSVNNNKMAKPPALPPGFNNKAQHLELYRQQQIQEQLARQKATKVAKSTVTISPDLDDIISNVDDASSSTIDASELTGNENSKVKVKKVKKVVNKK